MGNVSCTSQQSNDPEFPNEGITGQKTDQEILDEAKEISYETFRVGMVRLLNLCIEGYPRAVQSTAARRNDLLRKHSGDADAALAELRGMTASIKEEVKGWLLGISKFVKLPASIVLPTWKLMRRVCLVAGLYGLDLNSEETRAKILNAFSDNKAAGMAKYTVEAAIQMIWKSYAGPVARIVPMGKIVTDLANVEEKMCKAIGCDMFIQDKQNVPPDVYNELLDAKPSARDMMDLGVDGAQYALINAWKTSISAVTIAKDPAKRAATVDSLKTMGAKVSDVSMAAFRSAPVAAKAAVKKTPETARETIEWAKGKVRGTTK